MEICEACTTGFMAGPIPGTIANGERCDTCGIYPSDIEAAAALASACFNLRNAIDFVLNDYPEGGDAEITVKGYNFLCKALALTTLK